MVEFIIHAIHECPIHEECGHRLVSEPNQMFNYENVREKIGDIFHLPHSAPFVLIYTDWNKDPVSIVNYEGLADAMRRQGMNPLGLKVVQKCSSPILKVVHGDTHHLLTKPPRQREFCYERFHDQVRDLFKLPSNIQFTLSYEEPNFCGPDMTVASDAELNYALVQASPNNLQLDIRIIDDVEKNITSPILRKYSSHVVKIRHNGTLRGLAMSLTEDEFSYEQFQSRIRQIFKLSSSAEFLLSYVDMVGDNITISQGEELKDAFLGLPGKALQLDMVLIEGDNGAKKIFPVVQNAPYVVKILYKGSLRRLTLAPDDLQFSCENLRSRIRNLFKLSPSAEFVLGYIDEDQDNISIVEDEDLRDALVLQSLHPLMVNLTIGEAQNQAI